PPRRGGPPARGAPRGAARPSRGPRESGRPDRRYPGGDRESPRRLRARDATARRPLRSEGAHAPDRWRRPGRGGHRAVARRGRSSRGAQLITLKTPDQTAKMREAGQVVATMLDACRAAVRPGVTTAELDRIAAEILRKAGATSSFLGYYGYPATICTSVNDEIVHGIPSPKRKLREGDIIGIDAGAITEGLCLAIEPMINIGGPETRTLADRWTVVTADKSLSAHFEHTLACTAGGPVVLTAAVGAAVAACVVFRRRTLPWHGRCWYIFCSRWRMALR